MKIEKNSNGAGNGMRRLWVTIILVSIMIIVSALPITLRFSAASAEGVRIVTRDGSAADLLPLKMRIPDIGTSGDVKK